MKGDKGGCYGRSDFGFWIVDCGLRIADGGYGFSAFIHPTKVTLSGSAHEPVWCLARKFHKDRSELPQMTVDTKLSNLSGRRRIAIRQGREKW